MQKPIKNSSITHQELCDLPQKIAIFILRSKVQIEAFFVRQTQIANHTYDHETLSTLLKPSPNRELCDRTTQGTKLSLLLTNFQLESNTRKLMVLLVGWLVVQSFALDSSISSFPVVSEDLVVVKIGQLGSQL